MFVRRRTALNNQQTNDSWNPTAGATFHSQAEDAIRTLIRRCSAEMYRTPWPG